MSITLDVYEFDGPYKIERKLDLDSFDIVYKYDVEKLEDRSGVYAILERKLGANKVEYVYRVKDVGESAEVYSRIKTHDRHDQWENACAVDEMYVAVYYTPNKQQAGRKEIEQILREKYKPCCGDR